MTPMALGQLVDWIMTEHEKSGTVFGERIPYKANGRYNRTIFGRLLETPIGPAAGPHTQLTQNIVASYYTGSRFFELKTVQIMDGEELAACVNKPCIKADDEGYNCEWSTELYVPQAMEEYIKAWFLLKVMAKEFDLGDMDGFQFNISVGYDLEGIKSAKIDKFLNTMKEAKDSDVFQNCKQYLLDNVDRFKNVSKEDIEKIQSNICNSVTISTLHGCPPQEIEKIAMYLITEKGFHTFIKCNPTLLGYDFARKTMDEMGYDYIAFGDFHFKDDLQYEDAVPMLTRLMRVCEEKGLEFGVKITNTFPVDVKQNELPSEEMYMSGKSLYPLSIALASKLAEEFKGKLRIAYSGGADFFNIKGIVEAGIWPVTVATTLLKPGGYQRTLQMAKEVEAEKMAFTGVDVEASQLLAQNAKTDPHHIKAVKPLPSRKMKQQVPLLDCFVAPCKEGCPIHQDITTYLKLVSAGEYEKAMEVITEKNPLPFITGAICAHNCMSKCTRNFYEEPVHIRAMKLEAAQNGYDAWMKTITKANITEQGRVAVIGGGPAGMAAAYFLRRGGMDVTIFEKTSTLGGVVRHVIPEFRIASTSIDKDAAILEAMGVDIQLNTKVENAGELKQKGYTAVVFAVGASKPGVLKLEEGETVNALEFLANFKETNGKLNLGGNVVVIGGGNTAMDTARAAKRTEGVQKVSLVYRRTKRYMAADEEELLMAMEDGVEFQELLSSQKLVDGKLVCKVMKLGDMDASGRRGVVETDEICEVTADTVIAAVGEQVPSELYKANGITHFNEETLETSQGGVYLAGDGVNGPATVVEGIRDGMKVAEAILGKSLAKDIDKESDEEKLYVRRGVLKTTEEGTEETGRCLECSSICENCVEVCPNRANVAIKVPGMEKHQIIHVDYMCNECGNCKSFCPYDSAPYLDKFTLFASEKDMENSKNQGFAVIDKEKVSCKVRYLGEEFVWVKGAETKLPAEMVGISPWEIRYRNAIRPGQVLPNGQVADDSTGLAETLEAVKDIYESEPYAGIGCAMKNAGVGVGLPDWGRCRLLVNGGKVEIHAGASCIGQGLGTVLTQVLSEATGIPTRQISYHAPNTEKSPDSGTTSGSRQTLITGEAAKRASNLLKEAMQKQSLEDLEGREYYGEYLAKTDKMGSDVANPISHVAYGYATQVCVLNEDGTLKKIVAAHDVGKAVNPISVEGQIEGGVVMSLGYALTEQYEIKDGYPVSLIIEKPGIDVGYGAIGIGEITAIPTPPAVAGAYSKLTGEFQTILPLTGTPYERKKKMLIIRI